MFFTRKAPKLVWTENKQWMNSKPLTPELLKGKIVLLDFWTYSCVNCLRTLPALKHMWENYHKKGLMIIGVHTPEFEFEKDYDNVKKATEKFNVQYPVILDNDYKTWSAYNNHYWPRKYIIDIDGFIVYDHIGEGAYKETELKIQDLLGERKNVLGLGITIPKGIVSINQEIAIGRLTPEIYFGYGYSRGQLGNEEGWQDEKIVSYTSLEEKAMDKFYLDGQWYNNYDYMQLTSDSGKIYLKYSAKDVNIVAGADQDTGIKVFNDGVEVGTFTVNDYGLYNVVSLDGRGTHLLEIDVEKGLKAYTFTFG